MSTQTTTREQTRGATTQEFLSGKLAQVDIKRIEKELKDLWRSASKTDDGVAHVTRACVLNLILYSQDENAEQSASDLLDDIMLRHPCRAIVALSAKNGGKQNLEAWVAARCHLTDAKSMKQICCEQTTVRGDNVNNDELGSVVLPLVISDLPVFMWWQAPSLTHEAIKPFLSTVDRVIVDTACEREALSLFSEMLAIMNGSEQTLSAAHPIPFSCTDLNWRRSLPWRESLALAFDRRHTELSPDYLAGISNVEIRYGLPADAKNGEASWKGLTNQALLIVGWLSSTLGWRLQKAAADQQRIDLNFDASGAKISVALVGVPSDEAGEGDIGSIRINTEKPRNVAVVAVQQKGMPGIDVNCFCGDQADKSSQDSTSLFELDEMDESRLIDKELEILAVEPIFKRAVVSVVEILKLLQSSGKK
jgi:glucose-6-phosphate dehydrogenase assembly protein OpcA